MQIDVLYYSLIFFSGKIIPYTRDIPIAHRRDAGADEYFIFNAIDDTAQNYKSDRAMPTNF